MDETAIRYAVAADGAHIAYQVLGHGPRDLLCLGYGNLISFLDRDEEPHFRSFERRLMTFSRFIRFDPRGLGLSDPFAVEVTPSLDQQVTDAVAVLDAAGSSQAVLFASGSGGHAAIKIAAVHPERVAALVLVNSYARLARARDYEFGVPSELIDRFIDDVVGTADGDGRRPADDARTMAPSLGGDAEYLAWWARAGQRGASPALARTMLRIWLTQDVRPSLAAVRAPTLVVHRRDNRVMPVAHGRHLAAQIDGARLLEVAGADHLPFAGNSDDLVDEIQEFLTGSRPAREPDRMLATILFSDIVESTDLAVRLGDQRWRELLDRHDRMISETTRRFSGRVVNSTGDGVVATFDRPALAVQCGQALHAQARQLDIQLRVGIHTGELERRGDDIGGVAVHIAARVQAAASPGEVLVSRTVVDLVAGSGIRFDARGDHHLKGLPGIWALFAPTRDAQG